MATMAVMTHSARVAGPLQFRDAGGKKHTIPLGPCFVEEVDPDSVGIFWGPDGQRTATLTATEARAAAREGNLILLD